jgi:hypothetical protein
MPEVAPFNFQELDVPDDIQRHMPADQLQTLIEYDLQARDARELNDILSSNGFGRPVDVDEGVAIMQVAVDHMVLDQSSEEVFTGDGSTGDAQFFFDDDGVAEQYQDAMDSNVEQIDDGSDPVINGEEYNKVEDIAADLLGDRFIFDDFVDDTDNIDSDEIEEVVLNKINNRTVNKSLGDLGLAGAQIENVSIN